MFSDNTPVTDTQSSATLKKMAAEAAQTKEIMMTAATQTKLSIEVHETYEYCVSRVDPTQCRQEELIPKIEPPTMQDTQQTQLEASHHLITEEIIATIDQCTNTESGKDTSLFRRKLGVRFIAAATKKDKSLRQLIKFVMKRDWTP